ncbi:hypothetical protein J437_LFUL015098 [Ladona fulva]|uniref:Uncharacterized protein n=1 Tax=Ladona fulva TaxID=123851 RepID=A0A8K0NVV0_LADFU|nr:hypothetical protein J437_LFUL015098 [Ladona fulva]
MGFKFLSCTVLAIVMLCVLVFTEDVQETPVCPPDICSRVRCRGITKEECPSPDNYIDPKGGYCGCCPKCVKRSG